MRGMVLLFVLLSGCVSQYERAFNSYRSYLSTEVASGRLSPAEAEYLATVRLNQLLAEKQANDARAAAMLGIGLNMMNQPAYVPAPQQQQLVCRYNTMGPTLYGQPELICR